MFLIDFKQHHSLGSDKSLVSSAVLHVIHWEEVTSIDSFPQAWLHQELPRAGDPICRMDGSNSAPHSACLFPPMQRIPLWKVPVGLEQSLSSPCPLPPRWEASPALAEMPAGESWLQRKTCGHFGWTLFPTRSFAKGWSRSPRFPAGHPCPLHGC